GWIAGKACHRELQRAKICLRQPSVADRHHRLVISVRDEKTGFLEIAGRIPPERTGDRGKSSEREHDLAADGQKDPSRKSCRRHNLGQIKREPIFWTDLLANAFQRTGISQSIDEWTASLERFAPIPPPGPTQACAIGPII